MTTSTLLTYALRFALVFPAIILHEVAHGYAAYRLGDPTAKRAGRLTLNPIAHIDPVGTIILPIALLVLSNGAYFFGWAKPVPINPHNFRNQRTGMAISGGAGPATNIALAVISGLLVRAVSSGAIPMPELLATILFLFAYSNLVLAFFNLIPIPPLDGSRLVQAVLPDGMRDAYHRLESYGFIILIGLTWVVPGLLGSYLGLTVGPVSRLLMGF